MRFYGQKCLCVCVCSVWKKRRSRQDFCCCTPVRGTPTPPMPMGPILSALLAPAINICHPASLAGVWMTLLSESTVFLFFSTSSKVGLSKLLKNFCAILNGRRLTWLQGRRLKEKKEKRGATLILFLFWDSESFERLAEAAWNKSSAPGARVSRWGRRR